MEKEKNKISNLTVCLSIEKVKRKKKLPYLTASLLNPKKVNKFSFTSSNSFKMLNSEHNKLKTVNLYLENTKLNYKPKKFLNYDLKSKYPITSIGNNEIKTLSIISAFSEEDLNNKDENEKRTEYVLKFAKSSDNFKKLTKYTQQLSKEKQEKITDVLNKTYKLMEKESFLFLNEIGPSIPTHKLKKTIEKLINNTYYYFQEVNLLCEVLLKEVNNERDINLKLAKKNFEIENMLNSKTSELDKITEFVSKYEEAINCEKAKEDSLSRLKKEFLKRENISLITIKKLKNEIHDLTCLLDKNKIYYNKYKASEEENNKKIKKIDELNFISKKETDKLQIEINYKSEKIDSLEKENEEINKKFKQNEDKIEILKREIAEKCSLIKKYNSVLTEKNELLGMLHEEMESFRFMFEKEKQDHINTEQALNALEDKIYKENEEREEKERNFNKIKDDNLNNVSNDKNKEKDKNDNKSQIEEECVSNNIDLINEEQSNNENENKSEEK